MKNIEESSGRDIGYPLGRDEMGALVRGERIASKNEEINRGIKELKDIIEGYSWRRDKAKYCPV